ncbi:AMP-dependent synthetase/ligase, partial [Bdellovibrionota bacterium]
RALFWWAHGVGKKYSACIESKKPVPAFLKAKYALAYKLVFSKLKAKFGGRLKYFVTGGAPLSASIAKFFHSAGLLILEGWGLTETTGPVTVNRFDNFKFGTVGLPLKDVKIKIADDGELLVKSKKVFKGYFNMPEETAEVFTEDGWFKSGDIGEFDSDGFLKITDRKKDIIVTAGGKNIAPQKIENLLKTCRFIANVLVHGDQRKFLTALVTLNLDELTQFAKDENIEYETVRELVHHEKVFELIENEVKKMNQHLASFESVKRFHILERDFSIEDGELTPSLKVKRRFCEKRYAEFLNKLYSEQINP